MTGKLIVYESAAGDMFTIAAALLPDETEDEALVRVEGEVPPDAVRFMIVDAHDLPDPALRAAWTFDGDAVVLDQEKVNRLTTPETISDRQFFQQLAIDGVITEAEALAAVKTGDIPQSAQDLIAGLPQGDQFAANMLFAGATSFNRRHPLTEQMRVAFGWTSDHTDEFWRAASLL